MSLLVLNTGRNSKGQCNGEKTGTDMDSTGPCSVVICVFVGYRVLLFGHIQVVMYS